MYFKERSEVRLTHSLIFLHFFLLYHESFFAEAFSSNLPHFNAAVATLIILFLSLSTLFVCMRV